MTSQIVRTNPTAGTATTSSVRNNFGFAADEINRLLRANTDKVVATGTNSVVANFSNVPTFVLADGVRVLIEIANTTTSATPTLNVNSSGPKSIKKSDGSPLAIGDLVAGGYYEFVYDSGSTEWKVLNVSTITSQDALLTTILGGLYPVGGLLTTTNSANPGDADYFFSGITFGTWEAYAQGRVLVGVSPSATIDGGGISSDIATITTNEPHNLLVNSRVIIQNVTGITDPNGVHFVKYVNSPTSFSFELVGANETFTNISATSLAMNADFSSTGGNLGGESSHMQTESEVANHRHHLVNNRTVPESGNTGIDNYIATQGNQSGSSTNQSYTLRPVTDEANRGLSSFNTVDSSGNTVAQTAMNNLQPYITTYIWKRVVTP